jgi:hypothetical protein
VVAHVGGGHAAQRALYTGAVAVATAKRLLINNAFGVAASYANEAVVAPITLVRWFTAS